MARRIEWKVDDRDDWKVHFERGRGAGFYCQLAARRPQLRIARVDPVEREMMGSGVRCACFHTYYEVRARVHGWKSADVQSVEDPKNIQLPFLRQVGCVREYCEGYVHR